MKLDLLASCSDEVSIELLASRHAPSKWGENNARLVTKNITLVVLMHKKGEFSFVSKPNKIFSIRNMIGLLWSLRPGNDQPEK